MDSRFGLHRHMTLAQPLALESGACLQQVEIAYETYGELNADKSNAVFICHAITGDQYVASTHPITKKPGWWSTMVGVGKPFDTSRYCIICPNILGGCMGTSGPSSRDPASGQPYALRFPVITINDMAAAHRLLLEYLEIPKVYALIGGSMGGMQAMALATHHKDIAANVVLIACAARHSPQNIAFHEVGRQAIMADPKWRGGDYYGTDDPPKAGLAVARMATHITYLSEGALNVKFGRELQDRQSPSFSFDADFKIESYLRYQGKSFTNRFDANSYLYLTRAMNYFDLSVRAAGEKPSLAQAFKGSKARYCVVSFDSDWLFPTTESKRIIHALNAAQVPAGFVELASPHGHDSFLLDVPELNRVVDGFMRAGGI